MPGQRATNGAERKPDHILETADYCVNDVPTSTLDSVSTGLVCPDFGIEVILDVLLTQFAKSDGSPQGVTCYLADTWSQNRYPGPDIMRLAGEPR
jgi:hypothetical protein